MSLTNVMEKIERRYKITFLSAIIFGVVSQGMGLFNKFSFHDDANIFSVGATYSSGRWMLGILENLEKLLFGDGSYSLPLFNGLVSIICIALAACILVSVIDMKNDWACIFVGGLMTVFPVVTATMGFMFTIHMYMIALLLSVIGVFLICRKNTWKHYCIGVIIIACAIGIYQAYIPMVLGVMVLYLINRIATEDKEFVDNLKRTIAVGLSAVASLILYLVVNKIFLKTMKLELADYKGINHMGFTSFYDYFIRIAKSYVNYLYPTRASKYVYYTYPGSITWIYYIMLLISVVLGAILVYRLLKSDKLNALLVTLLLLGFPLCSNFIFVMTETGTVHTVMVYAQLLPFVLFAWLVEKVKIDNYKIAKGLSVCAIIIFISTNVMYCRYDNKCYLKAAFLQEEAKSYYTTMITQIKSTKGYNDEMPVTFVNSIYNEDKSIYIIDQLKSVTTIPYYNLDSYLNNYNWMGFMKIWCGFNPTIADENEFVNLPEVQAMPSYPDDGSVKVVNGTVVVKF